MNGHIFDGLDPCGTRPRGRRRHILLFGLALAVAGGAGATPGAGPLPAPMATAAIESEYRIGPGDELAVSFPYNNEIDHAGPVGPDGRFTMPLVGAIPLARLTVAEATARISSALRDAGIVADARPSLTIRQYGASVFVGGEVRSPGLVRLGGGMDAMQAVIVAGGLLDTARSKRVVVIRRGPDGTPALRYVDLRAYVRHGAVGDAGLLASQDIVFVPKSSVAEADVWVDQYINRLLPFSRSLNYSLGNASVNTIPK